MTLIYSLVGLVVGGLLQFLFNQHLQEKKHQRELRAEAYADYLRSVSEQSNFDLKDDSEKAKQLYAQTADSKCRIALYGAQAVISAFARFESLGSTMNSTEGREAFVHMVNAMRRDVLGKKIEYHSELEAVLIKNRFRKKKTEGDAR